MTDQRAKHIGLRIIRRRMDAAITAVEDYIQEHGNNNLWCLSSYQIEETLEAVLAQTGFIKYFAVDVGVPPEGKATVIRLLRRGAQPHESSGVVIRYETSLLA